MPSTSDATNQRTFLDGSYLLTVLTRIRALHPDFPLDTTILNSLLLSLVAPAPSTPFTVGDTAGKGGGLHVILRTKKEDIGLVVNLANLILTTLFGLHTLKHVIESSASTRSRMHAKKNSQPTELHALEDPTTFLRAFFFRRPSLSHRSTSHSRRSGDTTSSKEKEALRSSFTRSSRRSSSYPTPTAPERIEEDVHDDVFDGGSMASSRRVFALGQMPTPPSTARSRSSRVRPAAPRVRTDPLPLLGASEPPNGPDSPAASHSRVPSEQSLKFDRSRLSADMDATPRVTVPKAVIISGLEHASIAGQRILSQVLADRRLILDDDTHPVNGTWNLPEDFMVVYVCATDARERPPILRALLDKFALSADVAISPETRHAYVAYRATYSTSTYTSPIPSPRVLTPTIPAFDSFLSNGSNMSPRLRPALTLAVPLAPIISQSDLQYLRALAAPSPSSLAHAYTVMQPSLRMYFSDLFSAARHHPELDGTLLSHRTHEYGDALARAFRVLAGDSIGAGLIHSAVGTDDHASHLWDLSEELEDKSEEIELQSVSNPLSHDVKSSAKVEIAGTEVDVEERWDDYPPPARTESETIAPSGPPETWDVSEVDIARIFPRVASHRLRVRDGPDEEVLGSLMWPAVEVMPKGEERVLPPDQRTWVRRTVKDILVSVLADV